MKMDLNKEELEYTIKIVKNKRDIIRFLLTCESLKDFEEDENLTLQESLNLCDSIILKLQEESESWLK